MTPWDLQKSLIAEIEELLAQMQLKNAAGEDVFGVKGYEQRLPEITDDEEDQSQFFPYFIVRIEEGNTPTDDEPWLVGTTVLFGICDYDKETNGHRTILEMITKITNRFLERPLLDSKFRANQNVSFAFDSTTGFLTITMLAGGKGAAATAIKVSGKVIDPSKVTKEDVIGAVDPSTGAETGAQVIRQVYPRLGIVPGLILAPGWSQIPEVGLALAAKAAKINGVYSAMALLDLDTAKAKKYTDTKSVKEESGYTSPFCYPLWPCDRVGEYILAKSAVAGAMIQYMASDNEDVPNQSPSNHLLGVGGQCLEDGTEVYLDQDQANTVNGYGVTTAINQNGYRLWGNYTGAYPASSDAKDIWFAVRRMFSWQGNNFIQTYFDEVDDPMNNVLVQSVVDSENIRCSAYAPKYWAGASIEYKSDDNPKTAILAGTMKFRQHIAPYTPAQEIVDIIDYDTDTLAAAVGGN